jgi:hypothetical protein
VYSRAGGDVPQLLAADAATAVGLCGRHVAVGTRRGAVLLLDTQGKLVRARAARGLALRACGCATAAACSQRGRAKCANARPQVCKLPPHRGAVNDVSFDASGLYVATASEDGTVAVRPCARACAHAPRRCFHFSTRADCGAARAARPAARRWRP